MRRSGIVADGDGVDPVDARAQRMGGDIELDAGHGEAARDPMDAGRVGEQITIGLFLHRTPPADGETLYSLQ
ncbi:hypothetical protein IMZ11_07005 [Microtetraspora sp. AC03309]|uniref:hypothetical protein n=1 Tax=Microtetraspora sp. AC03309 TaxID=2779376 RepID=UPI001E47207F|nr:hypothetical protein [Microtetraspora sp. AC03309]MCC5575390.1 hypothetical protein [Microtetraspora sp. AC03309]